VIADFRDWNRTTDNDGDGDVGISGCAADRGEHLPCVLLLPLGSD
jgi:hypothetical protein